VTSTVPVAATFPATVAEFVTTPISIPVSELVSETHPPKPYDITQRMECVISMMEDTL
jgi:hypothetical protein